MVIASLSLRDQAASLEVPFIPAVAQVPTPDEKRGGHIRSGMSAPAGVACSAGARAPQ